tara:strand:+ start:1125 stop:1337 length:213 start_codon:yes stop_codon:yes gene_type:complete
MAKFNNGRPVTRKDLDKKLDQDDFENYLDDPETGSRALFKDHHKRLKALEKKLNKNKKFKISKPTKKFRR